MDTRNVLIGLIVSAVLAGVVVSCGGGSGDSASAPAAIVIRSATLTGAQEVPPNATTGTGRGTVIFNRTTKEITGGITFTGLTGAPTGAHIHVGAVGVDTSVIPIGLTIASDNATATIPANTTLSDTLAASLLAGDFYFNVHTAANGGGEIRGQINIQGGVIAGLATLNGTQEVPPVTTTATGRGMIVVDSTSGATSGDILIAYLTHDVTGANAAHIHVGAPGVDTSVIPVGLNPGTNVYTAPFPTKLIPQNVTDLSAGNFYYNVHSPAHGGGEIRGQIAIQ